MDKEGLKILLVCITNKNYGDTVIADCTEYLINKALGKEASRCRVLRYSMTSGDLVQIKYADAVVFAGGGLIKFRQEEFYKNVCEIVEEAEKQGVPVFFNSVGVEGFDEGDERCRMLIDTVNLNCVKGVTVRDDAELFRRQYVRRKGLRVKPVFDPAVWAKDCYNINVENSGIIGLNIARAGLFADYSGADIDEKFLLDFWTETVKRLEDKGLQWRIFTNGLNSDEEFAKKVLENIGHGEKLPQIADSEQLVKMIGGFSAVIATRMHACITACSLGLPCVGLVWSEKLRFWSEKTGTPERYLSPDNITAENAVAALEKAMSEGGKSAGYFGKRSVYTELRRFIVKECFPRKIKHERELGSKVLEVGMGGIQYKYRAPNSPDEMRRRLKENCYNVEVDIRASADGKAVCINGWTDKNLSLLGVTPAEGAPKELTREDFLSRRIDGKYPVCAFDEVAKLAAEYDSIRLLLDVGKPPKALINDLFADIAQTLKDNGIVRKRIMIRLQRESDVAAWKKTGCNNITLVYYLPPSDGSEEQNEKQVKAVEFCKAKGITIISCEAATYTEDVAAMLKANHIRAVVFSYDKAGDIIDTIERGAFLVGSVFCSGRYIQQLTH